MARTRHRMRPPAPAAGPSRRPPRRTVAAPVPLLVAFLVALLAAVLAAAPLVHAGAAALDLTVTATVVGLDGAVDPDFDPGELGQVRVNVTNRHNATVNVTVSALDGSPETRGVQTGPIAPNASAEVLVPFIVPSDAAEGTHTLGLTGEVRTLDDGNWTGAGTLSRQVAYRVRVPAPPEGPPLLPIVVAVGAAVAVGGAIAYLKLRGPRRTMPEAPTQEEVQRGVESRRESIVEAKRRDLEESIERARRRLERGEITQYQFDRIREQKEQQLDQLGDGDEGRAS